MQDINLFEFRAHFNRSNLLLCFNGPISRSLIQSRLQNTTAPAAQ